MIAEVLSFLAYLLNPFRWIAQLFVWILWPFRRIGRLFVWIGRFLSGLGDL
jgi:hypothetical protein